MALQVFKESEHDQLTFICPINILVIKPWSCLSWLSIRFREAKRTASTVTRLNLNAKLWIIRFPNYSISFPHIPRKALMKVINWELSELICRKGRASVTWVCLLVQIHACGKKKRLFDDGSIVMAFTACLIVFTTWLILFFPLVHTNLVQSNI